MLSFYTGGPETYRSFAENYYERHIPVEAIAQVYRHEPFSLALMEALGSNRRYEELIVEAAEIGYPTA
jgi:hypothetical protein